MAKGKQYVFSARTTEAGLKALSEVKAHLKVSWDELVIEAVSAHFNLDKAMMTLPKKEAPAKEEPVIEEHAPEETAEERPTEGKRPAKKQKGRKKGNKVEGAEQ